MIMYCMSSSSLALLIRCRKMKAVNVSIDDGFYCSEIQRREKGRLDLSFLKVTLFLWYREPPGA